MESSTVEATSDLVVSVDPGVAALPTGEMAGTISNQSRFVPILSAVKEFPRRTQELLAYLFLFLLIYSVCYVIPFGFSDDYALLYSGETKAMQAQFAQSVENDRPILAYLYDWTYAAMHNLNDLSYLRVVGIVGISLCAWLVYLTLRRADMSFWPAFLIPLAIFSLPSYQVLAAWSVCAYFSYAALLSGGALMLTERAFAVRYTRRFWLLVGLAVAMVIGSLWIYQPSGTMFWFFAAIMLLVRQLSVVEIVKRLALYLGVAVPAFLLAYESLHIVPTLLLGQDLTSVRVQLVQDIPGKALWFLQQPLVNALNLDVIDPTNTNALLIGVFIVAGLCLYFKGSIGTRLVKLSLAISLLPLCYLPNLVVADNWAAYRTLIALGPLVALYYALAIIGFISLFDYVGLEKLKAAAIAVPLGLFAIYSGMSAAAGVATEFAIPQYTEIQFLNSQLQPVMQQHPHVIYFVSSSWTDAVAPIVRYDEFGLPSSVQPWTPQDMVYLTLQESDPADENVMVKVIDESMIKDLPAGSIVVDMHDLKYERLVLPQY